MTLWLLCSILAAEASTAPPPRFQQEVVVTAAREEQPHDQAAAAVTVLGRETIEQLPAQSLAELLGFVPGVTMMFDGGASGIPVVTSRGFFGGGEVEYVKVLVDGVPAGDTESGNVDWQRFRAADIDRIEVLHGPGSALYGDAALGGVIQLFTRSANSTDSYLHASAGSFGARELAAGTSVDAGPALRLSAAAGSWETGGFREQADADDRFLHLALERVDDLSRWRLQAGGNRQNRRQPGPLTRDEIAADREQSNDLFRLDGQTTTRRRIDATYDSFGAVPLRAAVFATGRDDDNLRTLLLAPGFGTSAFRALTTRAAGGTFEASREWNRLALRAGTDVERATISGRYASVTPAGEQGSLTGEERGNRTLGALFVTGAWMLNDRVRLSAGLRRDEIRDEMTATTTSGVPRRVTASAWSPRAGINIHLGNGPSPVSLFVQASEAFKAPTLDQLFDPRPYPDGMGGTFTISNLALRPQRGRNLEAGLSRTTAASAWSLVAYRLAVRDEIDFDPQTFSYRNIGSSLHRGLEASAGFARNARLSPELTYAWTRVADTAAPDRQLKNIPEHSAQLLLHARLSAATRGALVYRWRSSVTLDDAGTFRTSAVRRVDLRLAHDVRRLRFELDVLNALDARYSELGYVLADFQGQPVPLEYPAPGRSVRLGMTWTFSGRSHE